MKDGGVKSLKRLANFIDDMPHVSAHVNCQRWQRDTAEML